MADPTHKDKQHLNNELYHEATRRASLQQPVVVYTSNNKLLLTAPNNIVFELFNTVVKEIEGNKLMEFIIKQLPDYFDKNWTNKTTQRSIDRLRREQAVDLKAGLTNIPIIKPSASTNQQIDDQSVSGSSKVGKSKSKTKSSESLGSQSSKRSSPKMNSPVSGGNSEKQQLIKQIYDHIMWRIKTQHVTQIISLLIKLALDDGYKRGKLKVETYEEIAGCFQDWRQNKLIKLYAFGKAPANDQKLLLSSTSSGDLTKWVANYIDGSEKKQNPDLIRKLAGALRDKTKNCIFITNDLDDAVKSINTGSIRCALIVDRVKKYNNISEIKSLITSGKIYFLESLVCVEFAPDPTNDTCC